MDASKINDKRIIKDFKSISFSGYKRTEVKKQLLQNILDGKIEDANYMCCELICCGCFMEVWEIILVVVSKHIYVRKLWAVPIAISAVIGDGRSNVLGITSRHESYNDVSLVTSSILPTWTRAYFQVTPNNNIIYLLG